MKLNQNATARCDAMIAAGISDPNTNAGKKFCTEECPYDICVAFEKKRGRPKNTSTIYVNKEAWVEVLDSQGYSLMEIALATGISIKTVERMTRARLDKQD